MSLQILERQDEITDWIGGSSALEPAKKGCENWAELLEKHKDGPNMWNPRYQDDSGI